MEGPGKSSGRSWVLKGKGAGNSGGSQVSGGEEGWNSVFLTPQPVSLTFPVSGTGPSPFQGFEEPWASSLVSQKAANLMPGSPNPGPRFPS